MQDQNKTQNPTPTPPAHGKWVRLLALIAAVAVILGSIFVVQAFGSGKKRISRGIPRSIFCRRPMRKTPRRTLSP